MGILAALVIAGMILFAVGTGIREISLYRKSLKGDVQYLVSRQRRNRRLLISFLLLAEAALLLAGLFFLTFEQPGPALLFWIPPLLLIVWIVYLSVADLRETSRDIDRILNDATEAALKKAKENLPSDRSN